VEKGFNHCRCVLTYREVGKILQSNARSIRKTFAALTMTVFRYSVRQMSQRTRAEQVYRRCQTVAKIYQNGYLKVAFRNSRFLVRGCVSVKVFG
jgi:hypothetical protein